MIGLKVRILDIGSAIYQQEININPNIGLTVYQANLPPLQICFKAEEKPLCTEKQQP